MYNINKELPIKDYNNIAAGLRGGYTRYDDFFLSYNYSFYGTKEEYLELDNEIERIKNILGTYSGWKCVADIAHHDYANYWSETEHLYFWTRINGKSDGHCYSDYCVYIKAYRK